MTTSEPRVKDLHLSRASFDAAIFDLDGVLTRTARVHAEAWKETLDEYLKQRAERRREDLVPFDAETDYRTYVDGRPRDEGARAFLESRGVRVPHGTEADAPDLETVWGLANRKRDRFLDLLKARGVEVDAGCVALVLDLRSAGVKTAVVSSSRNCRAVLDLAGLTDHFDAVLAGEDRASLRLAGKPAPDMFLEAARRLAVDPGRGVVFEDALVGVEAGRRGGFGCVVGVDRLGNGAALLAAGAHVTVTDLAHVTLGEWPDALSSTATLPSALAEAEQLFAGFGDGRPFVFLDYDGTLTPIVSRPQDARLPEETRRVLADLARSVPVGIVSGRDLRDVSDLVALEGLYYAGSHGFEIRGPDGTRLDAGPGDAFVPVLDQAECELRTSLQGIAGAAIERKRFTIAVHYRNVDDAEVRRINEAVEAVVAAREQLRRTEGKKVFELQPRIQWHKGKAVALLTQVIERVEGPGVPVYVGDDMTDEDAFLAVAHDGLPIVVRDDPRPTFARYALESPTEVRRFLQMLRTFLAGTHRP